MKYILSFLLAALCFQQAVSQSVEQQTYRQAAIYYNQDWEVTIKENAQYTRVASFPDSLHNIKNLSVHQFDKLVTDYHSNGAVMAKGFYNKGKRWGEWLFYYPNGQKEGQGMYEGRTQIGEWQYWRPDGKPLITTRHEGEKQLIESYWDEQGTQLVSAGNGTLTIHLKGEDGTSEMKLEGLMQNGLKEGEWVYSYKSGEPRIIQVFKGGKRVDAKVFENGKKLKRVVPMEDFEVVPSYDYLRRIESWNPDNKYFSYNYPMVAYVLGYKIAEQRMMNQANLEIIHYGVTDKHDPAAKPIEHGRQLTAEEMPNYPGGMEKMYKFLQKNIKVPRGVSVTGIIFISFDVDASGNLSNYKLMKGLHPKLDEETLRVVKLMPQWEPPKKQQDNKPFSYTLPIRF